ncbi:condensin-2 complex subunit D3 isoform X2 [Hyla sarda]|uniref:condensin-2 complex subunit D3 isoform X2 n=1 Tax=Hyla sarda TaxID=327740 RepID=UPI0024C42D92|nr:condensin-2 complex subunit D3 isoform X2 [Hyla sarda]
MAAHYDDVASSDWQIRVRFWRWSTANEKAERCSENSREMGDKEAVVLEALGRCGLRDLRRAWVESVWDLDFTETEPLDPRVEAEIIENGLEVFNNLYESLLPFASEDQENTRSAWVLFTENDICRNSLVAIFYHFIQTGEKKAAGALQRMLGLSAAGLYFLLLEIPGSVVNQVFHPVLFDKCVNCLEKCWPQDPDSSRKRKKDGMKSSQGDNRKGRKRPRPTRQDDIEMNDLSDEEQGEEAVYFSAHDLMKIRDSIILLLKNFLRLLPKFSLKDKPQSVMHCMQIFINLTSFETVPQQLAFSESTPINRMNYVPQLAYHGLWLLCLPIHGEGNQTLRRLFQRLLSVILMVKGGEGSNSAMLAITAPVTGARDQAVQFVSFLVDKLKEASFPVLLILLQHICAKFPDKSDYRASAAQALVKLLEKLPSPEYATFIDWLYKYSRNAKISYRVFALDVAVALLELPERTADASFPLEKIKFLQHKFLLQAMVFSRCSDKAPTVRSKALSCLAQCLEKNAASEGVTELLQGSTCRTISGTTVTAESMVNGTEASNHTRKTIGALRTIEVTDEGDHMGADGRDTLVMLRLRAGDEKTNVRKSALQVLVNILKYNLIPCSSEDLSTLQDRCRDPAVSVRKQALASLTELLQAQAHNVLVQKAWLTGLIPVVLDTESTIQEKTLECLDQLILQNIKHYSRYRDDDEKQKLSWDLLHLLTTESQDLSRYLTKAFHLWAKQDKFSSTLINNLISHTESEHSASAWMVLAKVAGSAPKLDYTKILNAWDQVRRETDANSSVTTGHILCVIGHIAKHLPEDKRAKLIDDVKSWLKDFKSPAEIISPAIETLQKLCYAHRDSPEAAQDLLNDVCGDLVSVCEEHISSVVMADSQHAQYDQELLVRHLFTLGEAAQLCPARVEKKVLLLVQSILASVHTEHNSCVSVSDGVPESQPLSQSQPQSQPLSQSQPQSQPLSQFRGSTMPPLVRAHAFITLGKLCLQHEDLAKKCIPALARELEVSDDLAIRNNVIIVICDLCIRYTTMVDRYIPNVSVCLKDRDPFIRKQTLIMLTNLLQEEFVKWKGSLFFHFVSVLVDPDPDIAKFGEFCLVHLLLKRNPVMFSQHFIECIFHFTSYEKHEKYNKFSQSERERKLFSLKGKENKEKRSKIYKFLLEHFTDEQRFNLTTKISQNVLACFVDGLLPIDMEADELLSDIFEIMSCKEIKLSAMRSKPGEDIGGGDDDEMAMANAVMQVAQKKLISQVQKKNFVENIIPIISSLKGFLEQQRIPALRDLMNYLREMMQDYRDEIKDFFAADKQLAAELEYDMKKYEEQLEREKEQENGVLNPSIAAVSGSPQASAGAGSPRTPTTHRSPLPTIEEVPGGAEPSTPIATPRVAILAGQGPRPRQMSLSTLAILNSARKTVENKLKPRSKSIGANPSTPSPSSRNSSKLATFRTSDQPSNTSLEGRAISTPEQTIYNVTFGAGVSYISANQTPASGRSLNASRDKETDVLCIMSPDKPAPQPRQWNVESPVQRSNRRQPSRRAPLKPAN